MKAASHPSGLRSKSLALLVGATLIAAFTSSALAENAAIATRAFNGYTRTRLPDGSFEKETYTFANGGRWDAMPGDSLNDIPFRQLVGTLAVPMAQRGYISSKDIRPEDTKLMIMVFWGVTNGTAEEEDTPVRQNLQYAMQNMESVKGTPEGIGAEQAMGQRMEGYFMMSELEQRLRNRTDVFNAKILGFQDDLWRAYDLDYSQSSMDLMADLRVDRYFVILKAYDFQLAWKEKRRKILWEARFSISRHGVDFVEALPAMATQAARYFGEDSKGLIRRPLPNVKITYGEAKTLKFETEK